jgi:hypothetical protein
VCFKKVRFDSEVVFEQISSSTEILRLEGTQYWIASLQRFQIRLHNNRLPYTRFELSGNGIWPCNRRAKPLLLYVFNKICNSDIVLLSASAARPSADRSEIIRGKILLYLH